MRQGWRTCHEEDDERLLVCWSCEPNSQTILISFFPHPLSYILTPNTNQHQPTPTYTSHRRIPSHTLLSVNSLNLIQHTLTHRQSVKPQRDSTSSFTNTSPPSPLLHSLTHLTYHSYPFLSHHHTPHTTHSQHSSHKHTHQSETTTLRTLGHNNVYPHTRAGTGVSGADGVV